MVVKNTDAIKPKKTVPGSRIPAVAPHWWVTLLVTDWSELTKKVYTNWLL